MAITRGKRQTTSFRKKAVVTAAVVGVTALGVKHLVKSAKIERVATEAVRKTIMESKLGIDPNSWAPVCRIYKLDLARFSTREFVRDVESFCNGRNLSLKQFFLTMELNKISQGQIRALENANENHRTQIQNFELTARTGKGGDRRRANTSIKNLNTKIKRNQTIQAIIEFCIKHKSQALALQKTRRSLERVKQLPDSKKK